MAIFVKKSTISAANRIFMSSESIVVLFAPGEHNIL